MKEKPILFSTAMAKAILDGKKSQTRRIVKPQPDGTYFRFKANFTHKVSGFEINPKYKVGDILWVRETWQHTRILNMHPTDDNYGYVYKASENGMLFADNYEGWTWKPSIFMPHEAARIFLKVTNIRVERLHDISEEDAKLEGVTPFIANHEADIDCWTDGKYKTAYNYLWNEINGWNQNSWDSNPWVWVIEFERINNA